MLPRPRPTARRLVASTISEATSVAVTEPPGPTRFAAVIAGSGDITAGYAILFTICAFAYVFTFVIHHLLAPKFEQFELKKG
jgi:hypothetical protein